MDARSLLAAAMLAMLLLPGCASASCPRSVDDLLSDEFQAALGPDHVAGIATVARYFDAAEPGFRGYDLTVEARYGALIHRSRDILVFLAVVPEALPEVESGDRIVFVGTMGEGRAAIYPVCLEPLVEAP